MAYERSDIAEWYSGKFILITGVTGFMGKVLLEKLLRSCPDIKKIYLFVRNKRGTSPQERLAAILEVPLFDVVRKENPYVFDKIILIEGDIAKADLGLSEEDRDELAQNVSVVFHCAATTKFHEDFRYAIQMNVIGTELLIQLCYEMKKLEAFVYLSTAFSNCHLKEIDEKIYDPPYDIEKLKMCLDCLEDDMLNDLRRKLIKDRPNTYSFTKAMAENIVFRHSKNLPCTVLRPSIVTASWAEPFPGWVDNLNGPVGIFMNIGKGLIRTLIGDDNCRADIIPVDISINMIIATAWYIAKTSAGLTTITLYKEEPMTHGYYLMDVFSPQNMMVLNLVSPGSNTITWKEFKNLTQEFYIKYPQNGQVWYPNGIFRTNIPKHQFCKVFLHVIPARIADVILQILGKPPMMVRTQKKLDVVINAMGFFTTNQWYFEKKNSEIVFKAMSEFDQKIFNFDFSKIEWRNYAEIFSLGSKLYVLKESKESLPQARQKMKMLKFIYYGSTALLYFIIFVVIFLYLFY